MPSAPSVTPARCSSPANLTSAAINDNMELGVLIERGPLPAKLSRHFALLIETDVLERVGP